MADLLVFNNQPLGALLPKRLSERLKMAANLVRYTDGELIHGRGDTNRGLSIVKEGAVRFGNPGADGSYVTTSIMGPGHYFGEATLFAELPRAYDAVAIGNVAVEQVTKKKFDRIFNEEPELARVLLIATTQRLYGILEFMDDLRRLPLRVRAAKLIAMMARSSKDPSVVKCNQSDLAFTLGVSRVSIGATLADLQNSDLIKLGYGNIEILNQEALSSWIAERAALAPLTHSQPS